MNLKELVRTAKQISRPYAVTNGSRFRIKDVNPGDTGELTAEDKPKAREALKQGIEALTQLQDKLYAQDRWAVLLIFQAMDAAGKDSVIKHVMTGVNPQGCQVASFKAPSTQELDHDYLWRCQRELPERGRIGIFNRSYYEEVLVVRVHPEILGNGKLPPSLVTDDLWDQRYEDIRAYERYLGHNGILIRKFFLHVSKQEQKKRFLERLDNPSKNWKFSTQDVKERALWKEYMKAYEKMIRETAAQRAPWYVVPADHKWFTRLVVAAAIIDALDSLDLAYPTLDKDKVTELKVARKALEKE